MNARFTTPAGRDVHDVIRDIADAMPADWTVGELPHAHGGRIVHDSGAHVFVRIGTYGSEASRLMVSAGVPDGRSYSDGDLNGVDIAEMSAGADRDPAAIAREIVRKVVPGALEVHAEITGRIERRTARANGAAAAAQQLADRMGTTAREWRGEWQADMPGGMLGDLTTGAYDNHGADIRVSVRIPGIPLSRALELADLIRAWSESDR